MTWRLIEADCIEAMQQMDDSSVDAICTDPPYGLGFMGKTWDSDFVAADMPMRRSGPQDAVNAGAARQGGRQRQGTDYQKRMANDGHRYQDWTEAWATEALRVLKPGGHLLAFGGTRTYHRLACAVEDAGFEIRDCLAWMYGSGFPKSLDVSKAIDKAAGAERGVTPNPLAEPKVVSDKIGQATHTTHRLGEPLTYSEAATPDAEQWQGWGTALKPAFEPIVMARKPLVGTVAANVLEHGTGALNIDGTRIGFKDDGDENEVYGDFSMVERTNYDAPGRWPANVVLDEAAAALLDEQSKPQMHGAGHARPPKREATAVGMFGIPGGDGHRFGDAGGASRFFYVAKSASAERNRGLEHRTGAEQPKLGMANDPEYLSSDGVRRSGFRQQTANTHPTVKPVELMQWLCRLVTPPGGTVLDPFTGSGSTGIAALREGFGFVGIEREAEYVEIARDRIIGDAPLFNVATEITREGESDE